MGHYIVRAVPVARTDERAGRVRERLIGHRCECASHVFVVAETGRLIGVADIGDVLAAGRAAPLADLAHTTKSLLAV